MELPSNDAVTRSVLTGFLKHTGGELIALMCVPSHRRVVSPSKRSSPPSRRILTNGCMWLFGAAIRKSLLAAHFSEEERAANRAGK